jgi:hypothetical protein
MEAGESIYLVFENFGNETLEYDPILGIEATEPSFVPDTMTLALIGGAVVVLLLVVVIVKRR